MVFAGVHLVTPMAYDATVRSIARCSFILTDSGGLQEEAPCLGKPVLVMRDETERPSGLEAGTLWLVGADRERIVEAVHTLLDDDVVYDRMSHTSNPYGDGQASRRIVAWLLARLRKGMLPDEFAGRTSELTCVRNLVKRRFDRLTQSGAIAEAGMRAYGSQTVDGVVVGCSRRRYGFSRGSEVSVCGGCAFCRCYVRRRECIAVHARE